VAGNKSAVQKFSVVREPECENFSLIYVTSLFKTVRREFLLLLFLLLLSFVLGPLVCFLNRITAGLWIIQAVASTPWMGHQPAARPLLKQDSTNRKGTLTGIHKPSGIQTHNPRASGRSATLFGRGCIRNVEL
jgi:hypothetical protein